MPPILKNCKYFIKNGIKIIKTLKNILTNRTLGVIISTLKTARLKYRFLR